MAFGQETVNEEEETVAQQSTSSDTGSAREEEPLIEETTMGNDENAAEMQKRGGGDDAIGKSSLWKGVEYCQSLSSISSSEEICRICHSRSSSKSNPLINPCRCSGTLSFVHTKCLVKWLEMSSPKMSGADLCELCCYKYKRGSIFKIRSIHFPHIERLSIVMNALFFIALSIMLLIGMALLGFIQENLVIRKRILNSSASRTYHSPTLRWKQRGQPTVVVQADEAESWEHRVWPELSALFDVRIGVGFVFFLLSFFIAIFTQYRAEHSIFKCFFRFFVTNKNWTIRNYSIKDDPEMLARQEEKKGTIAAALGGTETERRSCDKRELFADERLLPVRVIPSSCFL